MVTVSTPKDIKNQQSLHSFDEPSPTAVVGLVVHNEVERATQVLANNGFSNRDIERVTKNIIDKWYNQKNNNTPVQEEMKLFYKALFSNMHQEDERVIKQIVKRNVKPVNPEAKIKLSSH